MGASARLTGGEATVATLINHGVDTVFGLPGVQLNHLFDALHGAANALKIVVTRHEQGAGYMALGYAQAGGRPGVCAVVPGAGMLNAAAALATAWSTNTPVMCLAAQNPVAQIGRDLGLLHEIPDQLAILRGLTKWAARAEHAGAVGALLAEAFRQMASGRPRPVAVELPDDVLAQVTVAPPGQPLPADTPVPDPELIERAAKLLGQAERPLIFAGGGVRGAGGALAALGEALQAPVVLSRHAYGTISDRHYLAQHYPAGHRLWSSADVVLAVGTRLAPAATQWGTAGLDVVRIDADPLEIARTLRPTVGIVADAGLALAALLGRIGPHNRARPSREDELTRLKQAVEADYRTVQPQADYLAAIRGELPDDGVFVEELTQIGYFARYAMPVYQPGGYISPGTQGTLGYGFAAALGAQAARPSSPVVVACGDGGFLFTANELATAVRYRLGVVAVVFNNNAFGNVRRDQIDSFGARVIGSDLTNPDFVRLAESFGAAGRRATTPEGLRRELRAALKAGGPAVIEVPSTGFADPWRFLRLPRVRPAG